MEEERESTAVVLLRPLTKADLAAVLAIEEASFSSPWTRESFLNELHSAHSQLTVAEQQGRIVGYLCCWYVADEVHILDIAVHPDARRQGIGERLLCHAFAVGRQKAARSASLEVRRSNLPARALYEKFKFSESAVRRRYYSDGEDALLMTCSLSQNC